MRRDGQVSRDLISAQARALAASAYVKFRPPPGRIALPDVCCDLIWTGDVLLLQGPMSVGRPSQLVGRSVELVTMGPYRARDWLGLPLNEITDLCLPLTDILPEAAETLTEIFRVGRARELIALDRRMMVPDRAAAAARALRCGCSVAQAATIAELSERQLERDFRDKFGVQPKRYARIVRFRRAMLSAKADGSIADAAARAGYADQSHFHKDTRDLLGETPRAALSRVGNVQDAEILTPDSDACAFAAAE
jgi:AraC-like DNA-binding protein